MAVTSAPNLRLVQVGAPLRYDLKRGASCAETRSAGSPARTWLVQPRPSPNHGSGVCGSLGSERLTFVALLSSVIGGTAGMRRPLTNRGLARPPSHGGMG